MDNVLKTILYCYPFYDGMMDAIEKLVLFKALKSFSDSHKTVMQAEKILALTNSSKLINELKCFVDSVILSLNEEEKQLLEYKYFQKKMDENFDYKSRKYYRHQKKLYEKLIEILKAKNFTKEFFEERYLSIYFIKMKYLRFIKMSEKGIAPKASTDRNI